MTGVTLSDAPYAFEVFEVFVAVNAFVFLGLVRAMIPGACVSSVVL